jgi:23S rRNA (uracil1939-C5)-methyltransferase
MREVIVEITSLAFGGDAVGRQQRAAAAPGDSDGGDRDEGRAVFVPLAAPGERVRARLVREKARVAWGELAAIERAGPDRIAPACPLFGRCGGCQWQQVTIEAQLAAKRAIVERALGIAVDRVVSAGLPFGYRERAQLAVGAAAAGSGAGGEKAVGFRARRSNDIVDVPACPLLSPALAAALPAARALGAALPEGTEIDLQAGAEGVHLNIARGGALDAAEARREIAQPQVFDRLKAAGVVGLAVAGKPALGRAEVDVAEAPDAPPLPVPAGGFAQVGRAGNRALVAEVLAAVGDAPGVVLELYAGSGNFTRHLVARAARVHACDADAGAVARGRRAAPGAAWSGPPPDVAADVAADVIVLDPPREGADRPHMEAVLRARRRIVYVSCDPQTLARDARRIAAAGFRLTGAVAVDLMPQTFHVEVVARFDRAPPPPGASRGDTGSD